MKFITLVTALAATLPAVLGLTINTPSNVAECEPTQFTWSGGTAPYYLSVFPAGQTSGTPYEQFPPQNGTSYTWNVDLSSGISITVAAKDAAGNQAFTSIITIGAGTSTSCANASVSPSGGSSATSGGSGGAASTAASESTGAGATATSSHSSSSATTTAAGSSSTHSSGAGRLGVSSAFGVAGVMGLVGALLF